jgi:Spy/CpxP family protein refolding chaperone
MKKVVGLVVVALVIFSCGKKPEKKDFPPMGPGPESGFEFGPGPGPAMDGKGKPGEGFAKEGKDKNKGSLKKRPPFPPGPMFGNVDDLKKRLDLTDEQEESIRGINSKYRELHESLFTEMEPVLKKMQAALLKEKVDFDEVEGILQELSQFDVKRKLAMIKHRIELESILTEQQREKFKRK